MISVERTLFTPADAAAVFAYLADFRTTTEWDPGTIETVRVSGDGGVGTRYRNVSSFLGRTTELMYRVEELRPGAMIRLRGQNRSVVANDLITVTSTEAGTQVTYRAQFDFQGALRWLAIVLRPAVRRLVDRAARNLQQLLDRW